MALEDLSFILKLGPEPADIPHDFIFQFLIARILEKRRVFFAHQGTSGKGRGKEIAHNRLGAEISHRHRGAVILADDPCREMGGLHLRTKRASLENRFYGRTPFSFITHRDITFHEIRRAEFICFIDRPCPFHITNSSNRP
jgi:hypothetical protein